MTVLADKSTRVIYRGSTGSQGTFPVQPAITGGTRMVGGKMKAVPG